VILSPKIQDFVTTSVSAAFPWTLKVDSIDFITILYSLLIVCHSILYSATVDKLEMKHDLSADTEITASHINDTFCLSDWLFWFILFLQFFLLLEITSSVSIIYISVLYSLNFTMLLYAACAAAYICIFMKCRYKISMRTKTGCLCGTCAGYGAIIVVGLETTHFSS